MSADNGIYVAEFPTSTGKEYRVAHLQNIEDVNYGSVEEQDECRSRFFGTARVFALKNVAFTYAYGVAENITILEYGVSFLQFDRPLR
jgi:hypothetical protein